ncbi:hypothetical protein Y032_0059g2965 [Ancylostoma ceylanicum]|uniref:Uncharacterized protein n=1 Tax=Ancylostoma ceylanicum TaxID=53326 RepID=A0A016U3C7_9BILA|nr:hypothetical protein Y032_0059g2965 [Ancylostoma ceylanicum]
MSTGVIQYAEHEYDNHFVLSIDLSILLIYRYFCPRVGGDMPIGVLQYAEYEYDNRFAPSIDLPILSIFRHFCPRVGGDMPIGVLQYAEYEYDNHIPREHRVIDSVDVSAFV